VSGSAPLLFALPLLLTLLFAVRRLRQRQGDERGGAPFSPAQFAFRALEGTLREVSTARTTLQGERDRAEARRRQVERLHSLILGSIGSGVVAVGEGGGVQAANPAAGEILGSIGSGVVAVGEGGGVQAANPAAGEILGCHPLTLVGRPLAECLPTPCLVESVETVLATGEPLGRQEVAVVTATGAARWLGVSISPMADAAGRTAGAVLLFSDLTEVRQLQEEVETKRRLASMGEMVAAIVHECRNGLGAMGGYARLLERPEMGEGERRQAVGGILEEIGAIEAVLAECLDYVRPRPVRRGEVALGLLAQEVARAVAAAEPEAAVVAEGDAELTGDREQLRQALVNVVRNAVQASPPGAAVRIVVRKLGEAAEVAVVDRGRGMSEEERGHLCDPFFTTRAAGTGLGMSIVKRIVAAHGGQLEVESAAGQGSTVRILFPVEVA